MVYNVSTADLVYTVDMISAVDMVYTVDRGDEGDHYGKDRAKA